MTRALVCMPTYNERENIREIIPAVLAAAPLDLLIIDDNSPDGTGEIVQDRSVCARASADTASQRGLGAGLRGGISVGAGA